MSGADASQTACSNSNSTSQRPDARAALGIAAGLAAGALWGLVFVAPRMLDNFGMVDVTAGRFLVFGAVAALMTATRPAGQRWPGRRHWGAALWLSILGFSGYYLLLAWSIAIAGTAVPSLIIGTIPWWMMLLGRPAHLRWRSLAPGLALTAAGIGLMTASAWPSEGSAASGQ